ncbi:hypothetical protein Angca_000141, partial [Angiostrongylus cantonensis]
IVIEIEALLNTRPLLYVDSEDQQILRPIDFIQNKFEVPCSFENSDEDLTDPTYLSSEEQTLLKTKQEAIQALQSSCKFTDRFWHLWKTQYLTSLRKGHQSERNKTHYSKFCPSKGTVVLINDPMQPRFMWKVGRIEELPANSEGVVHEAVVALPSHRRIRRPINLLVPLEFENSISQNEESNKSKLEQHNNEKNPTKATFPYNLRPRKRRSVQEALHESE